MRIISGLNRGEKLFSPVLTSVRPTKTIVKAALFNLIRPDIKGSHFLDLFAGSGAIGVQALCEGADHVFFVEKNARCIDIIIKNVCMIKLAEKATIVKSRTETFIKHHDLSFFDFVFTDPPYFYTIEQYCSIIEQILMKSKPSVKVFFEFSSAYDMSFLSQAKTLSFKEYHYGNTKLGMVGYSQ